MGSRDVIEGFERRMPLNCEMNDIKKLLYRTVERALMDVAESKLALSPSQETRKQKTMLRNQALVFLKSEWCKEICEYIEIDYKCLVTKGLEVAAQFQTTWVEAGWKRKNAK